MVTKISWQEFRDSGMLWWVNMILHTFGMSIVIETQDGVIEDVYPARVKYRGFDERCNTEGYRKVSRSLDKNAKELFKESQD